MERPFERPVPGNGCFRPASAAFLKTVPSLRRLVGCWFERPGATPLPGHGIQHPLVSVLLGGVVMSAFLGVERETLSRCRIARGCRCPLWVISGHSRMDQACPLYPREQSCSASA